MLNFFKKFFDTNNEDYRYLDQLYEGLTADQYTDPAIREGITKRYVAMYTPVQNPYTNPELYDPLNPPDGWKYDPYYEVWIKL